MPDRRQARLPGFWSQAVAILKLAATAMRNQFGALRRSQQGMRSATANKEKRRLTLPILVTLLALGVAANSCFMGVHGLARYAENQWPQSQPATAVIEVDFMVRYHLTFRAGILKNEPPDSASLEANRRKLIEQVGESLDLDEAAAATRVDQIIAHLEKKGIEGFTFRSADNPYDFVDIRDLSPQASAWLARVLAVVFGLLFFALILMPLSARNKDLGAVDEQLAWLYCLPLTGHEILSGRFIAAILVKPVAWLILLPLFTILFWAMGHGVLSIPAALVASAAISVASAGIEIAVESALRSTASYRLKKNVQSFATIFGTVCFVLAVAAGIAAGKSSGWIGWILEHSPQNLTVIPGAALMMPIQGLGGLASLLGILVAGSAICGLLGWTMAAGSLRRGLSSGSEREGGRHASASVSSKSASLARFEWLLLLRDRNLATMVLVVPLIMVFYQVLVNPEMLSNISAEKIAVFGFGCGIWAAITTAPHVLLSESRSLWVIFSLPVSVSAHFQRRTRVWRSTGVALAVFVITLIALWKGMPSGAWWRVAAALVGVWVISLNVYAIMMGNAKLPDAARGDRPKISVGRIYACMLVAGIVGATLWHGSAWQILASLVLWWFFGFGMWQAVTRRLEFLLEPTNPTESQLTLASALGAIILFFGAQALTAAVLIAMMPQQPAAALLYSYVAGGIAALVFCGLLLLSHQRQLPHRPATETRLAITLAGCTLVCIACGAAWLALLEFVPFLRALFESTQTAAPLQIEPGDWQVLVLAIVAAPIVEELVFRGFVLRIMQKVWSIRGAIFANALLFAIVHPALSFPPVFVLGLATAWLYTRTQKLWPSMLLHALYNAAICGMQLWW